MWTQIVGKIRKTLTPLVNHWWNVTFYVTARGLTTSPIPYQDRIFEMEFDFISHKLDIRTCDGSTKRLELAPRTVADFYSDVMGTLRSLGLDVEIHATPDEVADRIPFAEDRTHKSYDPEYAHKFWRILVSVDSVFKEFRSRFIGKCSPVHFFWGSFDLAVVFWASRTGAAGSGCNDARRLFTRTQQCGLLARRRGDQRSGLLFVHGSGARGSQDAAGPSSESVLSFRYVRVFSDV
jgi:hypothetical protein